jgi:hypothetical protein
MLRCWLVTSKIWIACTPAPPTDVYLLFSLSNTIRLSPRIVIDISTHLKIYLICCLQMVGTHESSYEVHRVDWKQPQPAGGHRHYLTEKATQLAAAPIHTGKKVIGWAWALAFKQELIEKKSEITMKFSGRLSRTAQSSRASLGAGDVVSPADAGDTANSKEAAAVPPAGKAGSHTVVTISGSSDDAATSPAAHGVTMPQPPKQQQQQQQQQPMLASLDSLEAAEAENEYTINPRLTLVFKEVWVSDRGVDRDGFGHWVVDQMQSVCCCSSSADSTRDDSVEEGGKEQSSVKGGGGSSSSSTGKKNRSLHKSLKERLALQEELAELDEQLNAAAAAGAKFIIPGGHMAVHQFV